MQWLIQAIVFGIITPMALLARTPGTGEETGVEDDGLRPSDE
jgi:hypothetical protein